VNSTEITFFVAQDVISPAVYDLIPTSDSTYNISDIIEVGARAIDDVVVELIFVNITIPNGTISQLTLNYNENSNGWYNLSYTIPNVIGQYNITVIANDTSGNVNSTETTFFISQDLINPNVSLVSPSNASTSGLNQNLGFSCNATDNVKLSNMTLFVWNSSDEVYYNSAVNVSETFNESSWVLNMTNLDNYTWNCMTGDTSGNSAWALGNYTLEVTATAGCPLTPQNWNVDMSEYFVVNSLCNLTGYNITFSGVGNFTVNSSIYVNELNNLSENMTVWMKSDGIIWMGSL
jgi:hypothetical protein